MNDDVSKGTQRLLAVVAAPVAGERLRDEITKHLGGEPRQVFVLSPALARDRLHQYTGDVDEGVEAATERLNATLEVLRSGGIDAEGAVGDSEPDRAIEDTLARFPADEILILTHPDEKGRWLEDEAFARARDEFEQPVTHIVIEGEGEREHIADVEEAPAGRKERPAEERRNLPPMSPRDLFGIVIAVVGTILLWVLAGTCDAGEGLDESSVGGSQPNVGDEGLNGCDARLLIAGGVSLINLAHIAGLMLFESVRYHGFWAKLFSWMSLILTPAAIVVSLIVG